MVDENAYKQREIYRRRGEDYPTLRVGQTEGRDQGYDPSKSPSLVVTTVPVRPTPSLLFLLALLGLGNSGLAKKVDGE